jgi:hypothetical protein
MTLNREVLLRDPVANSIPNDGVTKIGRPTTPEEWNVLEWELSSFVCTGEYAKGLERILSSYLANLDGDTQPAVWVSGFYGSGKSHFVRVLEHLWLDEMLPSGSTARGLAHLPREVEDALVELTNAGKREGGLWSAAGKLSAGAAGSFRLAFLGVLLNAADLPTDYAPARLALRLIRDKQWDTFAAELTGRGLDVRSELLSMYVSKAVGEALLAARPDFAPDEQQARMLLREQYPNVSDVSEEHMLEMVGDILATRSTTEGKLPCALVVLDELQQFINNDGEIALAVQEVVEACCSKFGANLLFVGTGQAALQANTVLSKFQDRFTVGIHLTDTDIEEVVRQVILQKKEDRRGEIQQMLDSVSGEIDSQLANTKIASTSSDAEALVPDYPILPSRRRFWEAILKAIDQGGGGLLRSQLRSTHEAARRVAEEPLGHVIGADFIFEDQEASMIQTGVLLREVDQDIRRLDDDTPDGKLLSRLCATIFLVSRLPRETGVDLGIVADADTLAHLVVEDLRAGCGDLRRRVPEMLNALVEDGRLQLVDGEYRLQTRVGQEWDAEFRRRESAISGEAARMSGDRSEAFKTALQRTLGTLSLTQGHSKVPRKVVLHFGESRPTTEGQIPIWVQDGWSTPENAVKADAAAAGLNDPVVYLFLPKRNADEIDRALATIAAATEVLQSRSAGTDEAREAKRGVEARKGSAEDRLTTLVQGVLQDAIVYQGGGNAIAAASLKEAVMRAAEASVTRLYPRFEDADSASWSTALKRALEGSTTALEAVGFSGEPRAHPVCGAILAHLGSGKKGNEVVKHFGAPEYGWPKDAVNAALVVLLANEIVTARGADGIEQSARQLTEAKIGVTRFEAAAGRAPSPDEKLAVRGLCAELKVTCVPGDEVSTGAELVHELIRLIKSTGGDAPLPESPSVADCEELLTIPASERVIELAAMNRELRAAIPAWKLEARKAEERTASWAAVLRLAEHTGELVEAAEARTQLDALRSNRSLLADPDPLAPIRQSLVKAVRDALTAARSSLSEARAAARATLAASSGWVDLDPDRQSAIVARHRLSEPTEYDVGTDAGLLAALEAASLRSWDDQRRAVPGSLEEALLELAQTAEPERKVTRVQLPPATLKAPAEVDEYLARVKELLDAAVADGTAVVG